MTTKPHPNSLDSPFPGWHIAARELGVHRSHLHRVLKGERQSAKLLRRWRGWLKANPTYEKLQPKP